MFVCHVFAPDNVKLQRSEIVFCNDRKTHTQKRFTQSAARAHGRTSAFYKSTSFSLHSWHVRGVSAVSVMMMSLFGLAETKIIPKLYTPRVLPTIPGCLESADDQLSPRVRQDRFCLVKHLIPDWNLNGIFLTCLQLALPCPPPSEHVGTVILVPLVHPLPPSTQSQCEGPRANSSHRLPTPRCAKLEMGRGAIFRATVQPRS